MTLVSSGKAMMSVTEVFEFYKYTSRCYLKHFKLHRNSIEKHLFISSLVKKNLIMFLLRSLTITTGTKKVSIIVTLHSIVQAVGNKLLSFRS